LFNEIQLAHERGLHLVGQFKPFGSWARAQVSQGADNLLPGAFWSMNGLNQLVIGIGFVLVFTFFLSDIHATIFSHILSYVKQYRYGFWHYYDVRENTPYDIIDLFQTSWRKKHL
jgi:hypothetical protein